MSLIDTTDNKGFKLKVDFISSIGYFSLTVTRPDGKLIEQKVPASYEPVFGIDALDLQKIYECAEKIAIELEKME